MVTPPPSSRDTGELGSPDPTAPDLSLVMPCFNEENVAGRTIDRLVAAFRASGHRLEVVAVDNGSDDGTLQVLRDRASIHPEVQAVRVDENRGYGFGVLSGLPRCRAPWAGIIPADGEVDASDVVRLFEEGLATDGRVIAKVRRRFRLDGFRRKAVSVAYNLFFRLLWPGIGSLDVNGSPKIAPREALQEMRLHSEGWLLDPEIMVKGHQMGLRVMEFNVFARLRGRGQSHVRMSAVWDFFTALLAFRFAPAGRLWRGEPAASVEGPARTRSAS